MIENKQEVSKDKATSGLEKALQAIGTGKTAWIQQKEKQNEKKQKVENHFKYIMGGMKTGKTINGSFRTRADSRARLNGGRNLM